MGVHRVVTVGISRQIGAAIGRDRSAPVAEKIETQQILAIYREMGFDYFSRLLLCSPELTTKNDSHLQLTLVELKWERVLVVSFDIDTSMV